MDITVGLEGGERERSVPLVCKGRGTGMSAAQAAALAKRAGEVIGSVLGPHAKVAKEHVNHGIQQVQARYAEMMKANRGYVKDTGYDALSQMTKELYYTRWASLPVRYAEASKQLAELKAHVRNYQAWTLRDAGMGALVAGELAAFYTVGEILGRGSLLGYSV